MDKTTKIILALFAFCGIDYLTKYHRAALKGAYEMGFEQGISKAKETIYEVYLSKKNDIPEEPEAKEEA